ncbi:hypothetical protein LBMAG18_05480 [Alphaproteobacteria bacterium]|nr:hypothetical protein LBMAG18_05480 [Alphaproteobacteria bacterium]
MPSEIISLPCAFNSAALVDTAIVGDGLMFDRECARKLIKKIFLIKRKKIKKVN